MVYITSDLHGYPLRDFLKLLDSVSFSESDDLYILGDLVDRGPEGAELLKWASLQYNVQIILGNHEAMLLSVSDWLFDEVSDESLDRLDMQKLELLNNWYANGAAPTIKGLRKLLKEEPDILEGILDYLQDAPLYDTIEVAGTTYILVHSGLENFRKDRLLDDYTPDELLWARPTLDTQYFDNATVIFGHTPTECFGEQYRGKIVKTDTWICVDVGAASGRSPMLLCLDTMEEYY